MERKTSKVKGRLRLGTLGAARAGFTLTEVIVVMAILGIVLVGTAQMLIDTGRQSFITTQKFGITADVRQFTLEMAENARAANHFYIYRSFAVNDRNTPEKRLRDGEPGDFLLLIYQEPWPNLGSPVRITRLVGYFRQADPTDPLSEGPVYRLERRYHAPDLGSTPAWSAGPYPMASDHSPESLISGMLPTGNYTAVIQLSRGLADGQLFFNYLDRSIMIKAEIIHGNVAKRITDTYNYTVSPRG